MGAGIDLLLVSGCFSTGFRLIWAYFDTWQVFVDFASNWFFYVVFTFLPQYLSMALGFSIEDASWLTGANIAMGIVSTPK